MYRIPRGDISLARRFIDNKQEGVYPAMAKESVWTKLRRKVDKEFADELQRQQDIEQQEREQAKALEKQQKKEAAIAAYREKRDLTVADFFASPACRCRTILRTLPITPSAISPQTRAG